MGAAVDPLSVDVDLEVTVDGSRCSVWNENELIVVNAPTLAAARALLSGVETLPLAQRRLVGRLSKADLTIEIRVRHVPIARVGAGVEPSRLAATAGYDADLSLGAIAVAAWRWVL